MTKRNRTRPRKPRPLYRCGAGHVYKPTKRKEPVPYFCPQCSHSLRRVEARS